MPLPLFLVPSPMSDFIAIPCELNESGPNRGSRIKIPTESCFLFSYVSRGKIPVRPPVSRRN